MPFDSQLDDLYFLGIVEAASQNGLSCGRADQMEFVGDIIDKIQTSILQSRVIVAEVTSPNPNVYYEIGFASGAKVPVILVTRDPKSSAFDIAGQNQLVYKDIRDIKVKLGARLKALLSPPC